MSKYSQKKLLLEGFFELMNAIDPKASANLLRPFEQIKSVYKAVIPSKTSTGSKKHFSKDTNTGIYDPKPKRDNKSFIRKNNKLVNRIADTERDVYNRDMDIPKTSTINMRLSDGRSVRQIVITSRSLNKVNSNPERYLYDMSGRFIKKL